MKKLILLFGLLVSLNCNAVSNFRIDHLELGINETFSIPSNTTQIAISNLTMREGSRIIVPETTRQFKFIIDNGVFENKTAFIQETQKTSLDAGNITVKINHGRFKVPSNLNDAVFSIISRGGNGVTGNEGADGADARRKSCRGGDGSSAQSGARGGTGGRGGNGGMITAHIKLVKNHPVITNKQFPLASIGGEGGSGGPGGAGGQGADGKCCGQVFGKCTYRRGGFSAAGGGGQGTTGPKGVSSEVKLKLEFE